MERWIFWSHGVLDILCTYALRPRSPYQIFTLFMQLNEKEPLVFLGLGDVRRNVRILRWLEVRPPPVSNGVLDNPLLLDAVLTTQRLE